MIGRVSHLRNILKKIEPVKVQLFVFLFCGFSYLLLYSFFSQESMSLLSWQDHWFHLRLIRILDDQSSYTPFFEGHPVPYPVLFHHLVRIVSTLANLTVKTSLLLVSCLVSFGSGFLIFLIISEISKDNLAGLIGVILLGVGANFTTFFSETIFFGGAFIFPVNYFIAGFLPNLMGHFFGLSLLYLMVKSTLKKPRHILFCGFLGAALILSHLIASATYLIAAACLSFSSYITHENIKFRQFGIILFLSIAISSFWWLTIMGELTERSHLILLSNAGKNWSDSGFVTEIVRYYGFIPIFSLLGAFYLKKISKINIFLVLWASILFILLFTQWGARFALELAIPLYMLGAVGISQTIRWALSRKNEWFVVRLTVLVFVFACLCDIVRLFEILKNIFIQKIL